MSRSWRSFALAAAVAAAISGRAGAGSYISATGTFTMTSGAWEDFNLFFSPASSSLILSTLAYAGGTNACGETIAPGGIDSILTWYDSGGTQIAQNDDGVGVPGGRDSLLSYLGTGVSYLAPQPSGYYRLHLTNYGTTIGDGHWSVDIANASAPAGPQSNITLQSVAGASSNLDTLTLAGGAGTYPALAVDSGSVAISGRLTAKSDATVAVMGGALVAGGDIVLDGGMLARIAGTFAWAAGKTMTVKNGGHFAWTGTGSEMYTIPDGATIDVTGSGSYFNFSGPALGVGSLGGTPVSMNVSGGAAIFLYDVALVVNSGTLTIQDTALTDTSDVHVRRGGRLDFVATDTDPMNVMGSLWVDAGQVTVTADPLILSLEVTGQALVTNGGIIKAEHPSAIFAAEGGLWLESGGRFDSTTGGDLYIRDGKSLTITSGGRADLDDFATSGASVVVDGATSSYSSGLTAIGEYNFSGGAASMTVRNGAHAVLGTYISACPGVFPSTSTTGSLAIETGGQVTADDMTLAVTGDTDQFASVTITGGTSRLTQNAGKALTLGSTHTGTNSTATFTVNGGTFAQDSTDTLVLNPTGTFNFNGGVVALGTVQDHGGTMNFNAGRLSFVGDLLVGTGGLLGPGFDITPAHDLTLSGTTTIDPGSVLGLSGGSLSTGSLVPNGRLQFLSGTLALTGAGGLSVSAGGPLGKNVALGPGCNLSVAQTTSIAADSQLGLGGGMFTTGTLANAGLLALGDTSSASLGAASTNSGEILLSGGASCLAGPGALANAGLIRGDGRVACAVSNAASGEIRAEAGKRLLFELAQATNLGLISLQGGTADFAMPLTNGNTGVIFGRGTLSVGGVGLTNQGSIGFSGGYADVFGDVTNSPGARIVVSGGATATFYDDVDAAGGEMRVGAGCAAVFFGSYNGGATGTGTVYIEGDLRPGHSPATTTFEGGLIMSSGATLVAELAGLVPGSEYDRIEVAGSLALGGTLEVELLDGFAPRPGQAFDLLDFDPAGLSGRFDAIALPALGGGLAWDTSNLCSTGAISVVPEPASLALLAVGSLLLRRRREQAFCAKKGA